MVPYPVLRIAVLPGVIARAPRRQDAAATEVALPTDAHLLRNRTLLPHAEDPQLLALIPQRVPGRVAAARLIGPRSVGQVGGVGVPRTEAGRVRGQDRRIADIAVRIHVGIETQRVLAREPPDTWQQPSLPRVLGPELAEFTPGKAEGVRDC